MKASVQMIFERETKGAVRYQEVDASGQPVEQTAALVGTLYIRKFRFAGDIPSKITVTVEANV